MPDGTFVEDIETTIDADDPAAVTAHMLSQLKMVYERTVERVKGGQLTCFAIATLGDFAPYGPMEREETQFDLCCSGQHIHELMAFSRKAMIECHAKIHPQHATAEVKVEVVEGVELERVMEAFSRVFGGEAPKRETH
jgi:hypothetical protein